MIMRWSGWEFSDLNFEVGRNICKAHTHWTSHDASMPQCMATRKIKIWNFLLERKWDFLWKLGPVKSTSYTVMTILATLNYWHKQSHYSSLVVPNVLWTLYCVFHLMHIYSNHTIFVFLIFSNKIMGRSVGPENQQIIWKWLNQIITMYQHNINYYL